MHPPSPRVPNIIQQPCRIKSSHSSILVDEKCTRPLQLRVEEFYLFYFLFASFCCVLFLSSPSFVVFLPRDYPQPTPFPYT